MNNNKKIINFKLKTKILNFCIKISENIWKVEAKTTLDMVYWLISWWNVLLSEIWRHLKERIWIKQTVKRLSRNLNNFREDYLRQIKENLLIQNRNKITKETVITLDWWDINKEWALKMEYLKKVHDGSTGKLVPWYCLNSVVATNIDKNWKPINIPLNLRLYSTKSEEFISENNESIKTLDEVLRIIWTIWIWVFDRWYDRLRWIIKELLKRNIKFIIRAVWTREVIRIKDWEKMRLKELADKIRTRKRVTFFEYKGWEKNRKIKAKVWYEKIKIWWKELILCVLKKLNWELSMMMITNIEVKNNTDVVKIFSKYSSRWWVEDTFKFMKQEFQLEKIMLKNYKSLKNMMIFLLASMNFVSKMRRTEDKYFTKYLIKTAKALNEKVLKYVEHSIISWIRVILALNSLWIRDFVRKKLDKLNLQNLRLFGGNLANPYEILGKP